MPTFEPPTYTVSQPGDLFTRLLTKHEVGQTVWKDSVGVWHTQASPTTQDLNSAATLPHGDSSESYDGRYVFIGGHVHTVSSAVATELTAAGFSVT